MSGVVANTDIVMYVIYLLGGSDHKVHTEDIAYEAAKIAPDKFAWTLEKYKKYSYPDKLVTSKAFDGIRHKGCKGDKGDKGQLIKGKSDRNSVSSDGFMLTSEGKKWIKANKKRIVEWIESKKQKVPGDISRFIESIRNQELYKVFDSHGSLSLATPKMLFDMLMCTVDAPSNIIERKFNEIKDKAKAIDHDDILGFLECCSNRFDDFLNEKR
jgi:hypothetical protein